MLVSHGKKFIFIKTAKTAGTSVESYFEQYCMEPGTWTQKHEIDQQITEFGMIGGRGVNCRSEVLKAHLPAKQIKRLLPEFQWEDYLKFSVIRNPYDRLVSRFFFNIKRNKPDSIDFDDKKEVVTAFRHYITQKLHLMENSILIDGVLATDILIRYESLQAGVAEVCRKIAVKFEPERFPFYKASIRNSKYSLDELYDRPTIRFVEENYASELERFNYSFPCS